LNNDQQKYAQQLSGIDGLKLNQGEFDAINKGFQNLAGGSDIGGYNGNVISSYSFPSTSLATSAIPTQIGQGVGAGQPDGQDKDLGEDFWSAKGGASLIPGYIGAGLSLAAAPGAFRTQRLQNERIRESLTADRRANDKSQKDKEFNERMADEWFKTRPAQG
jgi:hypothetical protein